MFSAFGVDHGEIEKGFFGLGAGKRAAQVGRYRAAGRAKIFGSSGGARKAGAHRGAQYGFKSSGGKRKAGAHALR